MIETLSDERSWTGRGAGFRLVDDGGLFTIIVATPARTDQLCRPLQTNGRFSCARNGWVAINSDRWFGATDSWPADLETYRRYLINHEIGHYILVPATRLPGCRSACARDDATDQRAGWLHRQRLGRPLIGWADATSERRLPADQASSSPGVRSESSRLPLPEPTGPIPRVR